MTKTKRETLSRSNVAQQWFGILKGVIYSITISLILIVIFAVLIKLFDVLADYIIPINQVIKIISLFFGCYIGLKGCDKGLIKGMIIGGLYSVLSYFIFSILCGEFNFGLTSVTDLLFAILIGGICGMLAVNFKRK